MDLGDRAAGFPGAPGGRVHLHDEDGVLFALPAGWTDVAPADPFVVIADGRCPFTHPGGISPLSGPATKSSGCGNGPSA